MSASTKKTGLGKGLGSLFGDLDTKIAVSVENGEVSKKASKPDSAENTPAAGLSSENIIHYLSVDKIKPNAKQPRKAFDPTKISELSTSIKENGLIQPILVIPSKSGYELVAGERRLRAAREAGYKEIPAIVRSLTEEQNTFFSLIENMQREDLNPVEEALAMQTIIRDFKITNTEMGKRIGKSRPYVANTLRILNLPDSVVGLISEGRLSAGHAKAIGMLDEEKMQENFAEQIIAEGISVKRAEQLANITKGKKRSPKPRTKITPQNEAQKAVEDELSNILQTKVVLSHRGKSGHIEIAYYSRDQLEDIIESLRSLSK